LVLSACRKAPQREVERLAILPIENLSDPSDNPTAAAVSALLLNRTAGLADLHSLRLGSASDVPAGRPSRVLRGYLTRSGKGLRVRVFLQAASSGKTIRLLEAGAKDGEPAAEQLTVTLATALTGKPVKPATASVEAVRAYGEALTQPNIDAAIPHLRKAVAADANFDDAWLALVQALAATDRSAALDASRQALANDVDEITKSRLALWEAQLEGDVAARGLALEKLARLQPADAELNTQAAQHFLNRREYPKALELFVRSEKALSEAASVWNEAAYAHAYAGRFDEALQQVERYAQLEPAGPNPMDSRGDILYMAGRFADAEQAYLASYKRDPRFVGGVALRKAAWARRMMGDIKGADAHLDKYLEAGRGPFIALIKAQWRYSTGRQIEAERELEKVTADSASTGDLLAQINAQRSVWRMLAGDRSQARAYAESAAKSARTDSIRATAIVCVFVASPEASASEWTLRAERAFPDLRMGSLKHHALAYALLFGKHYREAALVLKDLYFQTPPSRDGQVRTLLAWSLMESGKPGDTGPLLAHFPHPEAAGESTFDCLAFPRFLALRARATEVGGDPAKAKELAELYKKYSGQ
jgi:tetratricopeptide (TPR) repeat protein